MSPQATTQTQVTEKPTFSPVTKSSLQRACVCGKHTRSGECEECKKKREDTFGRAAVSNAPANDVLRSPGQPLDITTLSLGESRLGHDFTKVTTYAATTRAEQPALKISRPGDIYEQEADRVADQVLSMPDPGKNTQRTFDERKEKDEEPHTPSISKTSPHIQRWSSSTYLDADQIRQKLESLGVFPSIASQIASYILALQSSGQPIPDSIREFFEPRFGVDLSKVRFHIGSLPAQLAELMSAKAFTLGWDIVFGTGAFSPDTLEGRRLLAHELTHTIQQDGKTNGQATSNQSLRLEKASEESASVSASHVNKSLDGSQPSVGSSEKKAVVGAGEKTDKDAEQQVADKDSSPDQSSAQEVEAELSGESTPAKAPESPKEDLEYQAVIEQLGKKGKRQKTPPILSKSQVDVVDDSQIKEVAKETSGSKKRQTELAAKLPPAILEEQTKKRAHLDQLAEKAQVELTETDFMNQFYATAAKEYEKLQGRDIHENKQDYKDVAVATRKQVVEQTQTLSSPLLSEPSKDPLKISTEEVQLRADPPGGVPTIKNARTAAPKRKTDEEISLDDKSRSLDNALANHDVNGQTVNIDEGSLAFPVSGEQSFDEAGEAKREAQDKIEEARPTYRDEESKILSETQVSTQSLVNKGLSGFNSSRKRSFGGVFDTQKLKESKIETEKRNVFGIFQEFYNEAKGGVERELMQLGKIGEIFQTIINQTEEQFRKDVRDKLEYVYPPGFFDYSDFATDHKTEVQKKYEALLKDRNERLRLDEKKKKLAEERQNLLLREQNTSLRDMNKVVGLLGEEIAFKGKEIFSQGSETIVRAFGPNSDRALYEKAVEQTKAEYVESYFDSQKRWFIGEVKARVDKEIAETVVVALNKAKGHIRKGKENTEKAFKDLPRKEQIEVQGAYEGAINSYEGLEESVDERKNDIINDMSRAYNKSVGQLRATFDKIKEDVLTKWWEKAWKKLKAVVNAIIDFAKRIGQLLGRLAHLVGDIISSPRKFFSNLVSGIGQGFSTFIDRIGEFLTTAFFDWLRGTSGLAIQLPKDWGPSGIFSLFTQLLGLSTETIWQRMEVVYNKTIANAFRRGEVLLERGLEIFAIIKNEGLGGLWVHIKESLGNILDETLERIKETVLYAAIKKVILEIGKMLIPGGGFIAVAEKVIRLLQFIVEARDKILDLIESFVDSAEMAVKGNVQGIVNHITRALTKFITIALDFLVTVFGLGSLKEKVERIIAAITKPIISGIDWVLNKLKPLVLRVFGRTGKESSSEEKQDRKQLDLEETKEIAKPEKQEKALPDIALAKQTVRRALDSQLPNGARQVADVEKVLASVAPRVKPALIDLRAEEFMPGKPKEEGATGFLVRAKLQLGKDSLIDKVPFSQEGKVLSHEERWQLGVKGVRRAVVQLQKRGISEETIEAQFPTWQSEFGFTALLLNTDEIPWMIEGAMSRTRSVATVSPKISYISDKPIWGPVTAQGFGTKMTINYLAMTPAPGISGGKPTKAYNAVYDEGINLRREGGRSYYVKGHLLSEKLNGPGKWENLTPLSQTTNAQHERYAESHLKEGINHKKAYKYIVDVYYIRAKNTSLINQIRKSRYSTQPKADKEKVVVAEQYVPELLDITALELDPATRKKKSGGQDLSQHLVNEINESSPDAVEV